MAKMETRWFWMITRSQFDDVPAHHALDALRYDGARVETNPPTGLYLFSSAGTGAAPTVARLKSHGLTVAWQSSRPLGVEHGQSQAWEWFHGQNITKHGNGANPEVAR